ncbi:MAG: IS4 family transposase [Spirochaetaceae bacterium]|jgi:hypothetical protein|nr:IS4 family transposase [Spirochaetaceae bacterium]
MDKGKTSFEQLLSVLPEGWENKSKELGALTRGREIKNALDLLRLVFLYLTEGKSFSGTAVLLQLAGICSISKKAVFTRFQKCGEWLRWLCETIYRNNKGIREPPEWIGDRKVYLVDASDEPVHGSDKADYRLHYAIGLFDLGMKEMALTAAETGEKASNFKTFGEQDIVIGDRAYCSKQGIAYLLGRKSGFLFRFGTNRFHVYNHQGRRVNALGYFKGLKPGESGEKTLCYEHEGEYKPLRFCVMRKTKEAEEKGLETLRKTRMRKYGNKTLSGAQTAYNRYVVLVTSITDASPELVLDLYRHRWQIELVFKRLKSLFRYHEIPVHVEQSARAWFYGKLLLAALCETWVNKGRFSPSAGRGSP